MHGRYLCVRVILTTTNHNSLSNNKLLVFVMETQCVLCEVGTEYLNIIRLLRVFKSRRPGEPRLGHVRFVVYKVASTGQVSPRVLRFSHVDIITPILHTHLHLHVALIRRTNGSCLGTLKKCCLRKLSSIA